MLVRSRWIAALTFAALGMGQPSAAGVLTVEFDLSRTTVLGAAAVPLPVDAARVSLVLNGVDARGLLTAAMPMGAFSDFRLSVDVPLLQGTSTRLDFVQSGAA